MQMPVQMPIRQQHPQHMHPIQNMTGRSNIMPTTIRAAPTAEKQLTSFLVFTIRKVVPLNSREKATWADADIVEENFEHGEILRQIKRLDEKKETVLTKKMALKPFQAKQVNAVLEGLARREMNPNFEWSLVQLDSKTKDIPKQRGEKQKKETAVLTVYAKRAPLPDLNPVILLAQRDEKKMNDEREVQNQIEHQRITSQRAREADIARQEHQMHQERQHMMMEERRMQQQMNQPPQFPQHNQHGGHGVPGPPGIIHINKPGGGQKNRSRKSSRKNYHNESDSSESSYNDSRSGSESDEDSRSSASSDRRRPRRHSLHRGATRSHSRPRPNTKKYRVSRSPSPNNRRLVDAHRISAYGGAISQRPYAPEVPRTVPSTDIKSVIQAAQIEVLSNLLIQQSGRQVASPATSPQQRYVPPVITYEQPRCLETCRAVDDREQYVDDYREDRYSIHRQDAQEYMRLPREPQEEYRRPFVVNRRQSSPIRYSPRTRSPVRATFRRPSMAGPVRPSFNHPFAPHDRNYDSSATSSLGSSDRGFYERDAYREPHPRGDRVWNGY